MGILHELYGLTLIQTAPGTCPECGVKHDPEQPHNRDSLTYQYSFYDKHGRWPTWEDAMAHCQPEVKEAWSQALTKRGISIKGDAK